MPLLILSLTKIKTHIRDREYMSGAARDALRIKATSEIFTPSWLACQCIDNIDQSIFKDVGNTIIDRACGDAQFLGEVLIRKCEFRAVNDEISLVDFATALSTIYGVDLMPDNVALCRDRLLCGMKDESLPIEVEGCKTYGDLVRKNIVCADALRYHYRFDVVDDPEPYLTDGEKAEREGKLVHQPKRKNTKAKVNKVKYSSTLDNLISEE